LQDQLRPRVERLGYLGEFFAVAAHQPAALRGFVAFTEALNAALSPQWLNVVALAIATAAGNDYERHQHEQRCVVLGLDPVWVHAAEHDQPPEADAPLTADEVVLRALALAAFRHDDAAARPLVRHLLGTVGTPTTVAALLAVARYVAHSAVAGAIGLTPPVPSIFDEAAT